MTKTGRHLWKPLQVIRLYLHKNETRFGTRIKTLERGLLHSHYAGKIRPVKERGRTGRPMFDPVIGNDDFDVFWYNSLQVHPSETKGCFTVSYGCTKIRVALQCQDGKYKIADVELIP